MVCTLGDAVPNGPPASVTVSAIVEVSVRAGSGFACAGDSVSGTGDRLNGFFQPSLFSSGDFGGAGFTIGDAFATVFGTDAVSAGFPAAGVGATVGVAVGEAVGATVEATVGAARVVDTGAEPGTVRRVAQSRTSPGLAEAVFPWVQLAS